MPRRPALHIAALLASIFAAGAAPAAPTGQEKVLGEVEFEFNEDGSLSVIYASDGAIIHYDSFDIFAGEVLKFVQPSDQARVLNRIFGDATHIEGTLSANGIVYIVNPAGIFLEGNAIVEVGGLVAAAGNISNEDFLAGIDRFELTGPLVSDGESIRGDSLALLGARVENSANISAPDGTIALVAGDRVVLTRIGGRVMVEVDGPAQGTATDAAGVLQTGTVDAGRGQVIFAVGDYYSLAINHEGVTYGSDVTLRGGDEGVVLVRGEIDASSDAGGGEIRVLGDRIALLGARLDASGADGGGRIRVGGDLRGGGDLRTARRTFIDRDSVLKADASVSGDGGSVVVWGDEAAVMSGTISARGGAEAGDGGFAEISSLGFLDAGGSVDLSAPTGAAGTLLFDPQDIVIVGGFDDGSDASDVSETELVGDDIAPGMPGTLGEILFEDIGDASEPFLIFESEIESIDANIVLEARNSISVSGVFDHEIDAEGVGVVVVSTGNNLTMRTENSSEDGLTHGIDLGDLEWSTSDGGGIDLRTGTGGGEEAPVADISVGNLTTSGGGGGVFVEASTGSITAGDIDTSGADGEAGTPDGSAAGTVTLVSRVMGDLEVGDVTAVGGNADVGSSGRGGQGGAIRIGTENGDIMAGALDSSGGAGGMLDPAGPGGAAADIFVEAGFGEDAGGGMTLMGAVRAVDAAGTSQPSPTSFGVSLVAADNIEFDGVDGPQITTTETLTLVATSAGTEAAPIVVDAGDGDDPDQTLVLSVSDTANLEITTAGFDIFQIAARANEANIDVTQVAQDGGSDVTIEIVGDADFNTIQKIDTTQVDPDDTPVELTYFLADDLEGEDDVSLEVFVASDAVTAGGAFEIQSEDDIVLANGAIAMHESVPQGGAPGTAASLILEADSDMDGSGGIFADGVDTAINMTAGGADVQPGDLILGAGSGIGEDGAPVVTANLGSLSADVTHSGGIHLHNVTGDDVSLRAGPGSAPFSLVVSDGDEDGVIGDIHVVNEAGDLLIFDPVSATGDDITSGGSIHLGVDPELTPGSEIRFLDMAGTRIEGAGDVDLDGPVILVFDGSVVAGGDVGFGDSIDSDAPSRVSRRLVVDAGGTVRFGGDVGGVLDEMGEQVSGFVLRSLDVIGATELDGDRSFSVLEEISFDAIDASADDAAALTINAGDGVTFLGTVRFGGDVGVSGRLLGLQVDAEVIRFDAVGEQSVVTGSSGIGLNVDGLAEVPAMSNIGKSGGSLILTAIGDAAEIGNDGEINVGKNQKLTVAGITDATEPGEMGHLELFGETVIVGDISAEEIHVDADVFLVRAREGAEFFIPGTGLIPDTGTDLLANEITTTSAPEMSGSGNAPRFGTLSGTVGGAGAGSFQVIALDSPIGSAALVDASDPDAPTFFDLGLAVSDPGHETPPPPPEVAPLLPARFSQQEASGPGIQPASDAVMAFLLCAEASDGAAEACDVPPGSALDSERGGEIARSYTRLFGSSADARTSRQLLASGSERSGRAGLLRDLATLLAQLRLLGMPQQAYEELRDELLEAAGGNLQRDRLLADVRAHARGIPL